MNTNPASRPYKNPGTAGTTGIGGSSTANTYDYNSNMGGYPIDEPRAGQHKQSKSQMHKYPNLNNNDSIGSGGAQLLQSQFSISNRQVLQSTDVQFASTSKTGGRGGSNFPSKGNQLNSLRSPQTVASNANNNLINAMKGLKNQMHQRKSGQGPQTQ